jgi:hypothetical protein
MQPGSGLGKRGLFPKEVREKKGVVGWSVVGVKEELLKTRQGGTE